VAGNLYDETVEQIAGPKKAADANPYDATVQAMHAQHTTDLQTSLAQSADTPPARAADILKLSQRTGIPTAIIGRNYDSIRKRADRVDTPYAQMLRDTPALTKWIADEPAHAAVAHDDLEKLGALEWLVTLPKRAIAQSINENRFGALSAKRLFGGLTAEEQDQLNAYRYYAGEGARLGAGDSWFRNFLTKSMQTVAGLTVPEAIPTTGGAIVGGLIGGLAAAPAGPEAIPAGAAAGARFGAGVGYQVGLAGSAFLTGAGGAYDRYLAMRDEFGQPMDPDVAKAAALTEGAINAGLMVVGGKVIGKTLKAGGAKLFSRDAITAALRQPSVRAALGDLVKSYGTTLTEGTALNVALRAGDILTTEIAKHASEHATPAAAIDHGQRFDSTDRKGEGFLGMLARPDGGISSELSIGVELDGKETHIPALVPTLTPEQVKTALALKPGAPMPADIVQAATAFAKTRAAAGKPYFAQPGEQQRGKFSHESAGDVARELGAAAVEGAESFALVSAAGPALGFAGDLAHMRRAEQSTAFFQALGDGVAQSEAVKRAPEAVQRFIEHATKDGPVETIYAPVADWTTYWQGKSVDPVAMAARVTGDPSAYPTAVQHGGDLPIPTARYATQLAATEHNAPLSDFLRLGPDAFSPKDVRELIEREKQAPPAPEAEPSPVHAAVVEQFRKVGASPDVAEHYANLYEATTSNLAEIEGADAEAFHGRYGLQVTRPDLDVSGGDGATAEPASESPAPAADGAQATLPTDFGPNAYAGPERRAEGGVAPDGVERRTSLADQPIGLMPGFTRGDVSAAAAAMRAENPNIDKLGAALRAKAAAFDKSRQAGETAGAEHADTEPVGSGRRTDADGRPADHGVSESRPRDVERTSASGNTRVERETPEQREDRRLQHYADVFGSVLDSARQVDPAVNPDDLRAEFQFRVEALEERQAGYGESGADPRNLLRDIAKYGGVAEKGKGYVGELARLKEGTKFGTLNGIRNVLRGKTELDEHGRPKSGLPLDVMVQRLQQDAGKYGWIENERDLLDAIDEAARFQAPEDVFPGTDELRRAVGMDASTDWWKTSWRPMTDMLADGDALELAGDVDTSLNVNEFGQSLFDDLDITPPDPSADVLATGEVQPRLPGAEDVRDTDVATPEFDAPFSLTPPENKAPAGKQRTLFQSAPLTDEGVRAWGDALRAKHGDDVRELNLGLTANGDINFQLLSIDRGAQRAGLGSAVVRDVTRFADAHSKRIVLSPADKGFSSERDGSGATTSRTRLVQFYKRFGFVENTGRNFDPAADGEMYRDPTERATLKEQGRLDYGETDFFGNKLSDDGGADHAAAGDASAGAGPGGARGAGTFDTRAFATRTHLVTQSERTLGTSQVTTPEEAATAAQYLAKGAQERFDAIVTDAKGKPLGVVGSFKGAVAETHVYPNILLAEAIQIPDAAAIWFVHNHPSGSAQLSEADLQTLRTLGETFRDSGIENKGIIAVGSGEEGERLFSSFDGNEGKAGTLRPPDNDGAKVPVLEREFLATGKLGEPLKSAADALRVVPEFAHGQTGALLLDAKLQPIGFLPVDLADAAALRPSGRLGALYRAMSQSGAANTIIFSPTNDATEAFSLANAFHARGINVADVVHYREGRAISERAQRLHLGMTGEFQQPRRGVIRFGPDRQFNIALLERADLSTTLHEFGHLFLEMFGDVADTLGARDPGALTDRQRQLLADYGATLQRFGVERRSDIVTEHHEQFAREFEAYLMEGKAPSVELQSTFARFRAWLVGIYKSLTNLNVQLTPDVRRVFDRLLASDEAIRHAEAQRGMTAMFLTAADAGMTDAEFSLYRQTVERASQVARDELDRKLLTEVHREQTADWKAKRADLQATVEREVYAKPEYRALAAMQRGTLPDGSPMVEGMETPPLKLSKQMLVERYGEERLKRLPKPYVYTTDGGMDPETVAELYGYSSGDALLTAIEKAAPARDIVRTETNRRMLATHGSLLLDGTLHEAAQAAVANDVREDVIRAEMRALGRKQREVDPFVKAERAKNRTALEQEQAEREYERRWFEAEQKLRIAIAEGHKQVEIDRLTAEVSDLKAKTRGGAATIRAGIPPASVLRAVAAERVAAMRVRAIRPAEFWSASRRAAQEAVAHAARQDFARAITAKQQELINLALYRAAQDAKTLAETQRRYLQSFATERVRQRIGKAGGSYLDQIDGILDRYDLARVSQKALDRRASLRKWVASQTAEGFPVELPEHVLDDARRTNWREITTAELTGVHDAVRQIAHLATLKNKLLKAQADREFADVRDGLVAAVAASAPARPVKFEVTRRDTAMRAFEDMVASHAKLATFVDRFDGYEVGGPFFEAILRPINEAATEKALRSRSEATAMRAIMDAHYSVAEQARFNARTSYPEIGTSLSKEAVLALALNWGADSNRARIRDGFGWTDHQVLGVLAHLDARDLSFVQAVLDHENSFWPEIAAQETRITGVAPEKVEAASWNHPQFGPQRGGYHHLAYDNRLQIRQPQIADLGALQTYALGAYAQTRQGYLNARLEKVSAPVKLSLSVWHTHVADVVHSLTHREMLIDVGRLMRDRKVLDAIHSRHGDVPYQQMYAALVDIAYGKQSGTVIRSLDWVRNGKVIAGIGWNVNTALKHLAGVMNGAAENGVTWQARAVSRVFRDAASMEWSAQWVNEKSAHMRLFGQEADRDIADLHASLRNAGGWFDTFVRRVTLNHVAQADIVHSYTALIRSTVKLAATVTWMGAYEKALAEQPGDDARAIAIADQAATNAHGGGQIKDLAKVQRGGSLAKLFTSFYSYGSLALNQNLRVIGRTDFGSAGSIGQMLVNLSLINIAPAAFTVGLGVAGGRIAKEADWFAEWGKEALAEAMGQFMGLRELTPLVQGREDYTGPAGLQFMKSIYDLATQLEQGKPDRALLRASEDFSGTIFHVPLPAVQRSIDGWDALEKGQTLNPGALIYGPPSEAR
jgi:hypothetical protein